MASETPIYDSMRAKLGHEPGDMDAAKAAVAKTAKAKADALKPKKAPVGKATGLNTTKAKPKTNYKRGK